MTADDPNDDDLSTSLESDKFLEISEFNKTRLAQIKRNPQLRLRFLPLIELRSFNDALPDHQQKLSHYKRLLRSNDVFGEARLGVVCLRKGEQITPDLATAEQRDFFLTCNDILSRCNPI